MSVEWQDTTIGAVCLKVFSGGTPISTNPSYYGGAIPWLRTKEVNYGKVFDTEQHITELGLENSSAKLVPVNSVIVAMYGNGDTAGRVAVNKIPLTTNQACCNLVVDPAKADFRFVYYFLMGRYQELVDLKNGGAQQNLNGQLIKAFPFCAPDVCEQSAIADVFESLDDRITLLRETNATLEAIAQALFKSWFVDFDPVRAKMEGRAPEGIHESTAALFPDALEESALGWVPKGWRVGTLENCCSRVESGGTPKRTAPEYWGGDISWLTSGEVRNPIVFDTKEKITAIGVKESSAKLWPSGTTVVAMYGATAGEVCLLAQPTTANQACCGLIPRQNFRAFLFFSVRRERENLASKSSGSAQQNLNKGLVCRHQILIPSVPMAAAYENVVGALLNSWIENERQAQTLATLRDTLLPRLISGQLRLPEAEAEMKAFL